MALPFVPQPDDGEYLYDEEHLTEPWMVCEENVNGDGAAIGRHIRTVDGQCVLWSQHTPLSGSRAIFEHIVELHNRALSVVGVE